MPTSKERIDYINNWKKENTDLIRIRVPKGRKEACEEGDYEVALNYEVRKDNVDIFGWNPFPSYYNYRIFFRFSEI